MKRSLLIASLALGLLPGTAAADGQEFSLKAGVAANTQLTSTLPATITGFTPDNPAPYWDATVTPSLHVGRATVARLDPIHVDVVGEAPAPFTVTVPDEMLDAVRAEAAARHTRRVRLHTEVVATEFTQSEFANLPPSAVADRNDSILSLDAPRHERRVRVGGVTLTPPPTWSTTSPPGASVATFKATFAGSCLVDIVATPKLRPMRRLTTDSLARSGLYDLFDRGHGTVWSARAWSTRSLTSRTWAAGVVRLAPRRYASVRVEAGLYPGCPVTFDDVLGFPDEVDRMVRGLRPARS